MHSTRSAALVALVALALTGCSPGEETSTETVTETVTETASAQAPAPDGAETSAQGSEAAGSSQSSQDDSESATSASETAPGESAGEEGSGPAEVAGELAWGEAVEGEHMVISVGEPSYYKADEGTIDPEREVAVMQTVTVKNHSEAAIDPANFYFVASTGEEEAPQIFDSANGIGFPEAPIRPGRTLKFKIGWSADKGEELAVTVTYDDYEEIYGKATWAGPTP